MIVPPRIEFWDIEDKSARTGATKIWAKRYDNDSNYYAVFYIDNVDVSGYQWADSNGYFSIDVDTTKYSKGPHLLSVYYANTNGGWWDTRNIIFGSPAANASIQSWAPENGSTCSGTVQFWAKRGDSDTNHFAVFYLTDYLTADSNGYFSVTVDTTAFSDGPHKILVYYANSSSCGLDYRNYMFKNVTSSEGVQLWGVEDNSVYSGEVSFRAKRADWDNNHYGRFYIDDVPITGNIPSDDGGFFNVTVNTAKYQNGTHMLSVYHAYSAGSGWDVKHIVFSNPVLGSVKEMSSTAEGTIHLEGWAVDPDNPSGNRVELAVFVGGDKDHGGKRYTVYTNGTEATGISYMGYGDYHGFDLDVIVDETGNQPVYVYAVDQADSSKLVKLYGGSLEIQEYHLSAIRIRENLNLEEGETTTLIPEYVPENIPDSYKGVVWSSSDPDIAMVSSEGIVTGVHEGMATITATSAWASGITAVCTVTVAKNDDPPVIESLKITEITPAYYSIKCIATDDKGLVKMQFISWTDLEEESNAVVQEIMIEDEDIFAEINAAIAVADHDYATGICYNTRVRVTDIRGNVTEYVGDESRVFMPELIHCFPTVKFPSDLVSIEEGAFENAADIGEVVLPEGLVQIGSRAFANCNALVLIHMPNSVQEIGKNAFTGSEKVVFLCASDNAAAKYARENGIPYFTGE